MPARRRAGSHRCRSRAGSRARAARGPIARPCATASRASATSSAPPRSAPCARAPRDSSTRASARAASRRPARSPARGRRHVPVARASSQSPSPRTLMMLTTVQFARILDARRGHRRLCLRDRELAVVEDRRREHGVGAALDDARRPDRASAPTPPDAITGTSTASATARVSARSKPVRAPSRSMLVSRISPAPRAATSRAHVDGVDAGRRAPAVRVDLPRRRRRIAWRRSRRRCIARRSARAASSNSAGLLTPAVLMLTLSAPALSSARMSSTELHAAADGQRDEHLRRRPPRSCRRAGRASRRSRGCRGTRARRRPRSS